MTIADNLPVFAALCICEWLPGGHSCRLIEHASMSFVHNIGIENSKDRFMIKQNENANWYQANHYLS